MAETVIKKDIGGDVSFYHYANETAITLAQITNATVKVFHPGGAELIASASVTPAADGLMSVSISAAKAANVDNWLRAHFQFTYSSDVYTHNVYFHISPTDFDINFHFDDLKGLRPDIDDYDTAGNLKFYRNRERAMAELYSRLARDSYEPWRILNRSALETPFGFLWMSYICDGQSKHPDDAWDRSAMDYRAKYDEAFKATNIIEADDTSANIADDEARPIGRQRLVRG